MISASSSEGYDALFVTPVPEDLTCVICSLVLKQPLQLICGHRYCKSCFERLKEYATQLNTELVCPIDRKPIDLATVFPDNGIARTVRNLEVKCKRFESGCFWRGCLGETEEHEERCKYKSDTSGCSASSSSSSDELGGLVRELVHRVGKCEEDLNGKEKEIAHLKLTVKELKEKSAKNIAEITTLKKVNGEMGREISNLKQNIVKELKDESTKNNDEIVMLKKNIEETKQEISTLKKIVDINMKKNTENCDEADDLGPFVEHYDEANDSVPFNEHYDDEADNLGHGVRSCWVCCKTITIFAIGACDHPICYKCSARMRVLEQQKSCPSCQAEMKKVVMSSQERKFTDFTLASLKCKRANGFHFEEWRLGDAFDALFENFCNLCEGEEKPFRTFKELRTHLRREHERSFCQICIDVLSNFPSELKTYSKTEMVQHRKYGDKFHLEHPECEFCKDRFFDNDTLLLHLRESH